MAMLEATRHKTELHEAKERIESLLQQLEPEAPRSRQVNRRLTRRASHVEKAVEEEITASAFEEIQEKLEELLGQLHLEERQRTLGQVVEWFNGHKPGAQKDVAVLERADKECMRRENERAWAALGTEDRIRKKERNTVRQVQQFVKSVAEEYEEGDGDSEEELMQFDQRLLQLTDEQLQRELAELRRSIARKEKDVAEIMLNIAERGNFLSANSISNLRAAEQSMNLMEEQEKVWHAAEAELKRLQEQKDLIFDTVAFVKGRMKSSENRVPLNEDMANYLKKKRYEVESKHKEVLLAKRMEEHGKDLEPPSLQNLVRLREDTEELNQRIQLAAALVLKVSADSHVLLDFEKQTASLREGAGPDVEMLEKLVSIMDPTKDWGQDMVSEEDRRGVQIETERLAKKKSQLLALVVRMVEEQTALQKEWAEQHQSLKIAEEKLEKQEQLLPREEAALSLAQEQDELVAMTLACARSHIHPLRLPRGNPSQSRRPSRTAPILRRAAEPVDDDNESVDSSGSFHRQVTSSSTASAPRQKRTEMVDMSSQVPVWSADAVVAEAVAELQHKRPAAAEWVDVFQEDPTGRIRKSALAAQNFLFSQLDQEQNDLKLEVEELQRALQGRFKEALDEDLEVANLGVQDMERHLQKLRAMQALRPDGRSDLPARLANLQRCQAAVEAEDAVESLAPVLRPMREALLLEKENGQLKSRLTQMGPEISAYRADFEHFKRSLGRRWRGQKNTQLAERNRSRKLRQSCRELNLLREKVKQMQADSETQS